MFTTLFHNFVVHIDFCFFNDKLHVQSILAYRLIYCSLALILANISPSILDIRYLSRVYSSCVGLS